MLVVQWWRSFACPGFQAEGKRYHDWDGCIERITQLDAWPDVRTGSSTERLKLSISRPLLRAKADAATPPGTPALASSMLSATPPFRPCDPPQRIRHPFGP